tara:strand:+ start:6674 stop:8758 length:2085 start_codon:yes stop_codon:yes gene_type:complete
MDWTWGPTPQAEEPEELEGKSEEETATAQINTRISDLLPPYMYRNKHLVNRLAIYEQRKQHELKQLQESVEYQFIAQVAAFTNENLDQYWQENFNSMIDNNTQTERTITTFDIENARREAHVLADADVHRWCIYARALNVGAGEADMQDPDVNWVLLIAKRTIETIQAAVHTAESGRESAARAARAARAASTANTSRVATAPVMPDSPSRSPVLDSGAAGAAATVWDDAVTHAAQAQNDARVIGVQPSLDAATQALEAIQHARIDLTDAVVDRAVRDAEYARTKAEAAAWDVAEIMAKKLVSAVHLAGTKAQHSMVVQTLAAVKSARKYSGPSRVSAASAALRHINTILTPPGDTTVSPADNRRFNLQTPSKTRAHRAKGSTSDVKSVREDVQSENDAQDFRVHRFQNVRNATRLQYFLTTISPASTAALFPSLNKLSHDGVGWQRDMSQLRLVLDASLSHPATRAAANESIEKEEAKAKAKAEAGRKDEEKTESEDNYKYGFPTQGHIDAAIDINSIERRNPNVEPISGDSDAETYLDAARLHTYIPEVRSYYAQRCHHWFHQIIKSNYDSRPLLAADKWYNKTTWARLHHYYAPVLYGHMREIASVLKNTHPHLNLRDAKMKEALPWLIGKNGDAGSDQRSFLFAKCVALAIRGSQVLSGKRYGLNSTFVRIKSLRRLAMHAWKKVKQGYKA